MSVDTAFQRLRDANPVTDPAALRKEAIDAAVFVTKTRQRSIDMQTQAQRLEPAPVRRRRAATALAAAFLVSIVGIGVVLVASMRNGDEVSSLERRVAIIAEQASAYSDGELDAWLGYYTPDADLYNGVYSLAQPDMRIGVPYWFALNDQWVITGVCIDVSAGEVACPMRQRDDYHGRAGIALEAVYTFTFTDNDKITAFRLDRGYATAMAPYYAFDARFLRWLGEAHPEAEVDDSATAMLYLKEFIAQTDEYPIQPDTP
jgi:hypothetical protein